MPSPKRIRLRDLRKSPGLVTHEQLAAVIDAVVLIDEQTGGGGGGDGLPIGGTAGQILAKIDSTNYNTEWIDNFTSQVKHLVKAGVALTKGQAVYVTSANGTNMIVGKADNSAESTSSKTMGLIAQNLANNGQGYVITEGLLAGLDTSTAGAAGDPVYLGTNGNLIYGLSNKPTAPANLVFIGIVTRKQSNNGEIFVKVQNGFELSELHDVNVTSIANNQLLQYESATSLWKNKTLAQVIIAALAGDGTSGQVIQTNGSGVLSWVNNGGATINQFIRTTASSVVGPGPVTTITKVASLTIPANTFGSGSIFRIYVRAKRTNPSGSTNGSIRLVINSTDHPTTGSPTILLTASMTTAQSPGGFVRTVSVTGTTTRIAPTGFGTNSPGNDDMVANYAYSDITTIDWTVTQYFVVGATAPGTNETIELISLSVAPI
jgi:hypothetical protein